MYSGSRSSATVAPGPKMRIDESSVALLNAVKPIVVTLACVSALTPPLRSIRLTLPLCQTDERRDSRSSDPCLSRHRCPPAAVVATEEFYQGAETFW